MTWFQGERKKAETSPWRQLQNSTQSANSQFSPAHQRAKTSRWTTNLPRQREAAPRMDVFTQCRCCWMLVRHNPEFLANGKGWMWASKRLSNLGGPRQEVNSHSGSSTGPPQVLTSRTSQSPETACPWVQAWGVRERRLQETRNPTWGLWFQLYCGTKTLNCWEKGKNPVLLRIWVKGHCSWECLSV